VAHPVTRELANVGLVFLPVRYVPAGWVAKWAAGRALRRYFDRLEAEPGPRQGPDRLR
jgi:hypothetical protein